MHFDTHDVFVLQVAGRKRLGRSRAGYQVADSGTEAPRRGRRRPLLDIVLAPGDVLYVPRGFLHAATPLDEVSAHLTIGILADTWYDLLQDVAKRAADDVTFRAPLPIGYAFEDTGFAESVKETLERFASWVAHLELTWPGGQGEHPCPQRHVEHRDRLVTSIGAGTRGIRSPCYPVTVNDLVIVALELSPT